MRHSTRLACAAVMLAAATSVRASRYIEQCFDCDYGGFVRFVGNVLVFLVSAAPLALLLVVVFIGLQGRQRDRTNKPNPEPSSPARRSLAGETGGSAARHAGMPSKPAVEDRGTPPTKRIREVTSHAVHGRAPILPRTPGPYPEFVSKAPKRAGAVVLQLARDRAYVVLYGSSVRDTCERFACWWLQAKARPSKGWEVLFSHDLETATLVESDFRFPSSSRSSAELLVSARRRRGACCAVWGGAGDVGSAE